MLKRGAVNREAFTMLRLRMIRLTVLSCSCALAVFGVQAHAAPMLLAELRSFGSCFDCFPVDIQFSFAAGVSQPGQPGGGPYVEWPLSVVPGDVGQTFSVPVDLLTMFNLVLTHPGEVVVRTSFVVNHTADHRTAYPPALTNGSQIDVPSVTRIAPVLGPNFFGYHITDIT